MKTPIIAVLLILFGAAGAEAQRRTRVPEGAIINLYDAFGRTPSLIKDFGFSCITTVNGTTVLFDAGSNADTFRKNVDALGVDLKSVDIVVVSHAHFDHLNGIDHLLTVNPSVKIYFPYDIFWGAPVPFNATGQEPAVKDSLPVHMQYFDGGPTAFTIAQSGRFRNANIEYVKTSKEILPGMTLIATSSPYMGYYSCYPGKSFVDGQFVEQEKDCRNTGLPELSLSIRSAEGQTLLVGCSHTGVESIVKETRRVTNDGIDLLYGGFHMIPFGREETVRIATMLKEELRVRRVAPAHCTGHLAFKVLQDLYGASYLYAGLGETTTVQWKKR
jgi:7,8-dihydropterin-6-yl-methyl-4-(beta-D-ribofuranosyl)aminobenzene 5'-phosphate synthase